MSLFDRNSSRSRRARCEIPRGMWVKCPDCKEILYHREVSTNFRVCTRCNHHFRLSAGERLEQLFDQGKYRELFVKVRPEDPLEFVDTKPYSERIEQSQQRLDATDALLVGRGQIDGRTTIVAAMEYGFMGGSMGSVVGEKLTRAAERCLQRRWPLVTVACSGGARMQEGVLSLMQMAKISAALQRLRNEGIPFISVLADPTTGGVTASFAMLGDVNIAEPNALIGFAGPRVIEQTVRQQLPEGFQRSEFLLEKGMLDVVVPRAELAQTVARCLHYFRND